MRQKCRPRTIDKRQKERGRGGKERGRGTPREVSCFRAVIARCVNVSVSVNAAAAAAARICWIHCLRLSLRLQAVVATLSREFRLPWVGDARPKRSSQATPDPSELVATNVSCSLYHFIFLGRCSRNGTRKTTFDSAQSAVFLCIFCSIFFLLYLYLYLFQSTFDT